MILTSVDAIEETPIDRYLREQRDLTAVERFSRRDRSDVGHRQARYYRDLLPATRPGPGQQYAFEVDLDACTGCKACVAACHNLNGLDEQEAWRTTRAYHGAGAGGAWQQTVTAACHHCVEPACLAGCPVDAYDKDPATGIVVHLDDQCIGCSYCTLTCPYEVPAYNHRLGIVRKCDLCQGRLAAGEAPACVQGCPNGAIRVSVVSVDELRRAATESRLPGAPPSAITVPSTTYRTAHPERVAAPAHVVAPPPRPSHLPLVVMLVLTQLSVGALVVDVVLRRFFGGSGDAAVTVPDALLALGAGAVALLASVFHLGRPRYAYRAVIGIRHSWLSREIVAFGGFTALAGLYATVVLLAPGARSSGAVTVLGAVAAAAGAGAVACSAAVYVVTRRPAWRAAIVGPAFASTALVTGLAGVLCVSTLAWLVATPGAAAEARAFGRPIPPVLAALVVAKLLWEAFACRAPGAAGAGARPPVSRRVALVRVVAAASGAASLVGVVVATEWGVAWLAFACAVVAWIAFVAGELCERIAFFETSTPPR